MKFKVLIHETYGNTKDGWEVNQSHNAGFIEVDEATPRKIIRALRDIGVIVDARRIQPLGQAIRSTPYMGGHIDITHRNGKPLGFLELQDE